MKAAQGLWVLARARNVGTCRPDAKGEAQPGCPHESKKVLMRGTGTEQLTVGMKAL